MSEKKTINIPVDVAEFAQQSTVALDVPSIKRDQRVKEYMVANPGTSYFKAFHVIYLGASPSDTDSFAEGPQQKRATTVARAIEALLGGTKAQRDE